MLCVATLRLAVEDAAVRTLPLPRKATAEQPAIEMPPSVKLTLPVGEAPVTVAVNVTLAPETDGFEELASVVVVGVAPPPAEVHASISVMRDKPPMAPVILTRMRSAVVAVKRTVRLTRVLPEALPNATPAGPFPPCPWKSVTPSWGKVSVTGGSTGATG